MLKKVFKSIIRNIAVIGAAAAFCCISACITSVRNAPINEPFVYNSKVALIQNNLSKEEVKTLSTNLANYWVDSMRAPWVTKYFVNNIIDKPPVFDTANIAKTETYMNSYMVSMGYYRAAFADSIKIDTVYAKQKIDTVNEKGKIKKIKIRGYQQRATVTIKVNPQKPTIIDTLGYDLKDSVLQRVAMRVKKRSKIIPHKTKFTQDAVSGELNRLLAIYRNIGYYQLTMNNLIALADTMDAALLQPTLDPFAQAVKMAQAAARQKENPTVSITIMKRAGEDTMLVSSKPADFLRYRIGNISFFPETRPNEIPDTVLLHLDRFPNVHTLRSGNISIYNRSNKFAPRPMLEHLYFRHGDYYRDSSFLKTISNLSSIGAWQQVDYRNFIRGDTIDVNYFLVPSVKQNITTALEGSWNVGDFISTSNMVGIAENLTYRNRNTWRRAIQATTNVLGGIELGIGNNAVSNNLIQTLQLGASQSYSFPRFITPFFTIKPRTVDAASTILTLSANYANRLQYYNLSSIVANWGYQWRKKNVTWQYRPINIEIYGLNTYSDFDTIIKYNPYLTKAFNSGTVISQQLNYSINFPNKRFAGTNYFRFAVEESGGLVGLIKPVGNNIYRYVRAEAEYIKHFDFTQTQFAFRAFAGAGYNYGNFTKFGNTLPFYKQFFGGGPNSMRAWGLRQIGLGSNLESDTSSTFRDRYGDMQLEINLEYRYPIFALSSVKVNGAVFSDIGNVWNIRNEPDLPQSQFNFSRLGKDVAIDIGTGIRFDFTYFLIRVDFGLKLKDPARLENNGWMSIRHFTWRNEEFVIPPNPITNKVMNRNNYGIQLGIGLPF